MKENLTPRQRRQRRVRRKVLGTPERPRLCVFRSSKHIYVQVIDDSRGVTVAQASTLDKDYVPIPKAAPPPEPAAAPAAEEKGKKGDKGKKAEKAEKAKPVDKGKIAAAKQIGKLIATRLLAMNQKQVVFDRNGFLYHGRVKAVADAAREAGLEF
jgi:large subunit ribosomal protein L18